MCQQVLKNPYVQQGWTESDFYDKRKGYMLDRVTDAYDDRSYESKRGSASGQREATLDGRSLTGTSIKAGKTVDFDRRDSNKVSDADLTMIEQQLMLDSNTKAKNYKSKYPDGRNPAMENARSAVGRKKGETPNSTSAEVLVANDENTPPEDGGFGFPGISQKLAAKNPANSVYYNSKGEHAPEGQHYETQAQPDWHLSEAEKAKLRAMSRQELLDKFYGTDTSKY